MVIEQDCEFKQDSQKGKKKMFDSHYRKKSSGTYNLLENIAAEDPTMEDERLTKSKVFQANEDYVNDLVMQARFLFGSGFDPMVQYFCGTTKKLEVKGK